MVLREDLIIAQPSAATNKRTAQLMERYADRPMDLADATLVALAEELRLKRIFTLDSDFRIYRLHGRQAFEIVPACRCVALMLPASVHERSHRPRRGSTQPGALPAGRYGVNLTVITSPSAIT